MKVLFISANRAEINMRTAPLGMMCVAAAVRNAGHEIMSLDLMAETEPLEKLTAIVESFQPELIGVSIRNIDDQNQRTPRFLLEEDRKVVALCKSLSRAPVVLGGAGYSIFPESALTYSGADMGIQGEGEGALPILLERIQRGESLSTVPGLYLAGQGLQSPRAFVRDLDQLPLPEPEMFAGSLSPEPDFWFPVQTRRGCPLACSYCSTGTIEGTAIRKRSPQKVVEWMDRIKAQGVTNFYFVDNTFNLPAGYARELCREIIRAGRTIRWRCILYPRELDGNLAALMAESGCREASVGFESGCDRMLESMNKRFDKEDVRSACGLLKKHGIRRMGFLLLGGPGETIESIEESLAFADSLELDFLKITLGIRIYPYTQLAERAREQNIISASTDLIHPAFYLTPGREDQARAIAAKWLATRRNWIMDR